MDRWRINSWDEQNKAHLYCIDDLDNSRVSQSAHFTGGVFRKGKISPFGRDVEGEDTACRVVVLYKRTRLESAVFGTRNHRLESQRYTPSSSRW